MPAYLWKSHRSARLALFACLFFAAEAWSDTLLLPDDMALRNDIQLLADAGLLSGPVSGWPLSAGALRDEMRAVRVPERYQSYIREAWYRVMNRLERTAALRLKLSAIDEPVEIRRFAYSPRGSGAQATLTSDSGGLKLKLSLTLQDRSDDRRLARIDSSYAGWQIGNWLISAGAVPRWWGPGYESSLILSTSARPLPSVSLDTVKPIRFESRWLSWLGAMDWRVFAGKLESGRHVPNAMLLGARLTLRPTQKLEIGFSRTAQWGGQDRPTDFDSLLNLLLGRDNRGDAGITLADEPGNQLGGVDVRWLSPVGDGPYAVYLQMIGEDEAGGLPSRMIGLGGGEFWRGFRGGTLRVYAEAADTTIEFYKSMPRENLAYEHFIYRDGYRYRGRAIGHSMDNDGLMLSLGGVWSGTMRDWEGVIRRVDVNPDGRGPRHTVSADGQERWELWLATRMPAFQGRFTWGAGLQYINPANSPTTVERTLYASWERDWGTSGQ